MLRRFLGDGKGPDIEIRSAQIPPDHGTMQIIDVREGNEWEQERIAGSRHIPLAQLQRRIGEIDRDRPVLVVCLSGTRSFHAAKFLVSNGFNDAKSLKGGLLEWSRSGRPLEH